MKWHRFQSSTSKSSKSIGLGHPSKWFHPNNLIWTLKVLTVLSSSLSGLKCTECVTFIASAIYGNDLIRSNWCALQTKRLTAEVLNFSPAQINHRGYIVRSIWRLAEVRLAYAYTAGYSSDQANLDQICIFSLQFLLLFMRYRCSNKSSIYSTRPSSDD